MLLIILCTAISASAQDTQWKLEAGKAISQKQFLLPARTSEEIYRLVNRWLVKYYESPEENIKARIEGEYLRGVGYRENLTRASALTSTDLNYSFTFEISDGAVLITLADAIIISTASQDNDGHSRVEDLLKPRSQNKNIPTPTRLSLLSTIFLIHYSNHLKVPWHRRSNRVFRDYGSQITDRSF